MTAALWAAYALLAVPVLIMLALPPERVTHRLYLSMFSLRHSWRGLTDRRHLEDHMTAPTVCANCKGDLAVTSKPHCGNRFCDWLHCVCGARITHGGLVLVTVDGSWVRVKP